MAKCKLCRKNISDGTEYCDDCIEKKDLMDSESYLDSLLSSVQGDTTTASEIYKKRKDNEHSFSIDEEDLNDFDLFDITKDLDGYLSDEVSEEASEDTAASEDMDVSYESTEEDSDTSMDMEQKSDLDIHNIDNEFLYMEDQDIHNENEEDYTDPAIDDLLSQLDFYSDDDKSDESADNDIPLDIIESSFTAFDDDIKEADSNEADQDMTSDEELLSLLNQFSTEEADDELLSDLISEIGQDIQSLDLNIGLDEEPSETIVNKSDTNIDSDNGIQYITQEDTDNLIDSKSKKKKSKKSSKRDTSGGKGLLSKLFSSEEDEESGNATQKPAKKKKKKSNKKQAKKVNKKEADTDSDGQEDEPKKGKKGSAGKKESKKPKKEKKQREPIELLEELDGRISRAGATSLIIIFGVMVFLLMFTVKSFTYSQNVKNAADYFSMKKYSQAYDEIYGLEIKDEDVELYDKIMTVMYVNKHLDSYRNYYQMRKFPEALDALLNGLRQYNKYIEIATILGIDEDLDYVREQILQELYDGFNLTEKKAKEILKLKDKEKYSKAVYDVIIKNFSYY